MFLIIALSALSIAAFAYAVRLTLGMVADAAQRRDRIARAVRPVHGEAMRQAPAPIRNRLGED